MKKYRIKIEEVTGNEFKHRANIMIFSSNPASIVEKIKSALADEHQTWFEAAKEYFLSRRRTGAARIISETPSDKLDLASKGGDISQEDFIKNEIDIELLESRIR